MIRMATKKTATFTLTERVTITSSNTQTFASIDLGTTADERIPISLGGNGAIMVQLTDLNRGGLVFANDRALVASGHIDYLGNGGLNMETDLFPDNFGKGSDDGRYIVNDELYITGLSTILDTGKDVNVTVRVEASIVTLNAKDFMAIAIQSTAADN